MCNNAIYRLSLLPFSIILGLSPHLQYQVIDVGGRHTITAMVYDAIFDFWQLVISTVFYFIK